MKLPSRSARKSWRFRTPLVRWWCAESLCEVFVPCVSRSAGVSGHFCFGCLGRSGLWSHWWCDDSWWVGVRSVCDGVPLGGLGGEPLGFGTTLPGPGRRWLSLSVRRRCWDGGWRRPAVAGCASVVGCPPPLLWSRGAWHCPCILSLAGGMDGLPRSSRAPG